MVSRDTRVQIGAGLTYIALLLIWGAVDPLAAESVLDPINVLFSLAAMFVLFAGAHLYLAIRGEGGMVPVDARWRFVIAFAAALVLFFLGAVLADATPVAGIDPQVPVFAAAVVLLAGYFVYEAREGYLERRPE